MFDDDHDDDLVMMIV